MSNFGNNNNQERVFSLLDTGKLTMWAPNGEGKFSSLRFGYNKKNQMLVTIYTNIPNDTIDDGKIRAAIDPDYFYTWMELVEQAIKSTEPCRYAITYSDKKFIGPGKMTDGPVEHYTLVAGRDDQGAVFISVVCQKRPNIKFAFLSNNKNMFRDAAGNEMDKRLESTVIAAGKLRHLRSIYPIVMDLLKTEPKRPGQQGTGQQGGGFNRGGQGGGGFNRGGQQGGGGAATADFASGDNDIPW